MIIRLFLILFALNLFGCATTAKYEAVLDTWIGQNEGDLIDEWGPPSSVYEARGIKYLTYKWSSSGYVPGMLPRYQTTIVGHTVYTNTISGSPGYAYTNTCDTTFTIKNERIVTWRWKGNACTATEAPPDNGAAAYNRGDFVQAIKLFRPLAEQGDAEAQASLGLMYAKGKGVTQDDQEALKWFRLSAARGHEDAKKALKHPEMVAAAKNATTQAQSQLPQPSVSSRTQTFDDGKAAYNRGRYAEAINIFRLLAAEGHADAQNNIGVMYVMGQGVARDDQEALKWFRLSAAQGTESAKASLKRPEMIEAAKNTTMQAQPQHSASNRTQTIDDAKAAFRNGDYTQAIMILRPLAVQRDAEAQVILGMMYVEGQGVTQDNREAVEWFRLAANQGYALAQTWLGGMYELGRGVTQDDQEAIKWYRLAAAQGDEYAKKVLKRPEMVEAAKNATMQAQPQHSVSSRTQTSDDAKTAILKGNYVQAINIFRMLASQGDAVAQTDLGWMYSRGKGVTQNDREAVKWFRLAAEQGYAAAQNDLGTMYSMGFGVTEDDLEAVKWYRLSAAQGYAAAQSNLGTMFDNGEGVTQDYQEALKWYRLSAAQSHAAAQSNLGTMYKDGKGVTRNYQEALTWYRLAAAQGFEFAQESLKRPEMVEAAKNSKRR